MTTARRTGALALLGALTLVLSSCSLLPAGDGPDLADDDVITISRSAAGMFGYFGQGSTTIAADTISQRYELPNGAEIYEITEELDPEARDLIEERAGAYAAWEGKLSEKEHTPCTDIAATSVSISGSITHDSDVQDCGDGTPLRDLEESVRDAEPELFGQLAHPVDDWTIEIRPWTGDGPAGDGPDKSAPVERYRLRAAQHEIGMGITAENPPGRLGRRPRARRGGRRAPGLGHHRHRAHRPQRFPDEPEHARLRRPDRGDPGDQAGEAPSDLDVPPVPRPAERGPRPDPARAVKRVARDGGARSHPSTSAPETPRRVP